MGRVATAGRARTRERDARAPKRQLGAERETAPLAIVHDRPSALKLLLGRLAVVATVVCWVMYAITTIVREFVENQSPTLQLRLETITYLLVVTVLSFSALMYLVSRNAALIRFRDHRRVPRGEIDRHFSHGYRHGITVLVPSYVEELRVVSNTIWSAALQEFPDLTVVLLIDDPPYPQDPERIASLAATRALPSDIAAELRVPAARFRAAREEAGSRLASGRVSSEELGLLVAEYLAAAEWLEAKAARHEVHDHTDRFFVDEVLMGLASDLRLTVLALNAAREQGEAPPARRMLELYDRLVAIFQAKVRAFERKRYASLSQEANKAMNLNSYISLMGGRWKREETGEGVVLVRAGRHENADLEVPDSEYLLTLDADSMLLRDYCLRLVYLLEEAGNERVAVVQTPYSSYRGAASRLERIAGATTDVQHILHQGLTYYDATFWVGANAVIRKRALNDIAQTQTVGGYVITTYIQDRTVIEDTESSIDLGLHGWHLINYPERLSYSATPPDFGSLAVQRARWANGGLIILPKFVQAIRERRFRRERVRFAEVALRLNYLVSIAWASAGLVLLLGYPFDSRLLSPWALGAALPYFIAMADDLKYSGYRRSDVFRIYGFNIILLAVNIAGTVKSIQQSLTQAKIPFARTPKVSNRTAAPGLYVFVPYLIIVYSVLICILDVRAQNWGNAAFAAFNAVLASWALVSYIGVWNSLVDMWLGLLGWFYVPVRRPPAGDAGASDGEQASRLDWQSLLYHGDRRLGRNRHRPGDLRRRITPH